MSVRNFWIDASVDGRTTKLSGGPRAAAGGFSETIYVRDGGGIEKALTIRGAADEDGTLRLRVCDGEGREVHSVETRR